MGMIFGCSDIKDLMKGFSMVEHCDTIKNGWVRFSTPFLYPDGSHIDLFLGQTTELLKEYVLSDQGQTLSYLSDLHINPLKTKKKKEALSDICESLRISNDNGELIIRIPFDKVEITLANAITRLVQGCIRVSDFSLNQRFPTTTTFKEDVEEFLSKIDVQYEPDYKVIGRFGKDIYVDFKTSSTKRDDLILTLSTSNAVSAHQVANEAFRKWYDIADKRSAFEFITVYNSDNDFFKEEDLYRIKEFSSLISFPAETQNLAEAIRF
jgi:sporulation protein YlmC with PRC-barrel domain